MSKKFTLLLISLAVLSLALFQSSPAKAPAPQFAPTPVAATQPSPAVLPSQDEARPRTTKQVLQDSALAECLASLVCSLASPTEPLSTSELAATVNAMTFEDLKVLQQNALNQNVDGNERRASLFLLTKVASSESTGTAATEALAEIAQTPVPAFENAGKPHSRESLAKSFEVSLRITALEALDQRTVTAPSVASHLENIRRLQKDPTLSLLTQISLAGIAAGTPGKLNRAIQAMLRETPQ